MEWNFTTQQVANGDIEYTASQFREDLRCEVKENFPEFAEDEIESMLNLAFDVCYCTAMRHDLDNILKHCESKGMKIDRKYLELIRDSNTDNIEMLKAVLAQRISRLHEEGCCREEALRRIDEENAQIIKGA